MRKLFIISCIINEGLNLDTILLSISNNIEGKTRTQVVLLLLLLFIIVIINIIPKLIDLKNNV